MTNDSIVDEAKKYLLGKEVLASGYIMGVETSLDTSGIMKNYTVDIRVKWNVNEKQYKKLIKKIQSPNLNVSLMDDE